MGTQDKLSKTIEERIREFDPDVELIALERPSAGTIRVFIDRPGGVDLALCEAVTNQLRDLNENYSLEVSSPGEDRPLTKPEHFRRFLGRKVRVKTHDAIEGQRNFKGTLADADDETVTVAATGGTLVRIPLDGVERSNLIGEFGFGGES
ncbi:MAG: ribosome maturation factor RimP [Solirubrobacterales bacterium]|jgi:ribosome maturation factor RimP|nr:ribosome maturation factor RimP [Solirubrobacterales bacterium]